MFFCNNANSVKGQEKIEGFRLNDVHLLSALLSPDFKWVGQVISAREVQKMERIKMIQIPVCISR